MQDVCHAATVAAHEASEDSSRAQPRRHHAAGAHGGRAGRVSAAPTQRDPASRRPTRHGSRGDGRGHRPRRPGFAAVLASRDRRQARADESHGVRSGAEAGGWQDGDPDRSGCAARSLRCRGRGSLRCHEPAAVHGGIRRGGRAAGWHSRVGDGAGCTARCNGRGRGHRQRRRPLRPHAGRGPAGAARRLGPSDRFAADAGARRARRGRPRARPRATEPPRRSLSRLRGRCGGPPCRAGARHVYGRRRDDALPPARLHRADRGGRLPAGRRSWRDRAAHRHRTWAGQRRAAGGRRARRDDGRRRCRRRLWQRRRPIHESAVCRPRPLG